MASAELPGIGSKSSQTLQRVQEQYQLPDSRKAIVQAIEGILGKGGVQKLTLQLGQPIRVERLVKSTEVAPEVVPLDDDLYFAARNQEIHEFEVAEGSERVLLFAFREIRRLKGVPRAFIVNSRKALSTWIGVSPSGLDELYGVEVTEHKEIEPDVLLFVATKPEEPDVIAFSLKIIMEE